LTLEQQQQQQQQQQRQQRQQQLQPQLPHHRQPQYQHNTSQYRGVYWAKKSKKWQVRICYDGKRQVLGSFFDEEEAARAYDSAAKARIGSAATINFPVESKRQRQGGEMLASGERRSKRTRAKSGFYGVAATASSQWAASLWYDGCGHYLGTFDTKEHAAAAYDKEARAQKGESAVCNFESKEAGESAVERAAQAHEVRKREAERAAAAESAAESAANLATHAAAEWAAIGI
jgi:hypothetical protein